MRKTIGRVGCLLVGHRLEDRAFHGRGFTLQVRRCGRCPHIASHTTQVTNRRIRRATAQDLARRLAARS